MIYAGFVDDCPIFYLIEFYLGVNAIHHEGLTIDDEAGDACGSVNAMVENEFSGCCGLGQRLNRDKRAR